MIRKELIKKLLATSHLSVHERQIFKDAPIKFDEAKEAVKEALTQHRFFPPITDSWDNNQFYYDGLVIEKRESKYILHEQLSGATMNLIFDRESIYENIDDVIQKYLKPSNLEIDGIKIVE